GESTTGLLDVLYLAHQKSIDYRLRLRGPRKVDPNLALLTIDERAVATIGRWPWPRGTLAKALTNGFENGAKLMAFDISFAEPSQNPALQVEQAMHESGTTSLDNALTGIMPKLDQDDALGKVFAKYSDKIVAGSFFNDPLPAILFPPESDFCRD